MGPDKVFRIFLYLSLDQPIGLQEDPFVPKMGQHIFLKYFVWLIKKGGPYLDMLDEAVTWYRKKQKKNLTSKFWEG